MAFAKTDKKLYFVLCMYFAVVLETRTEQQFWLENVNSTTSTPPVHQYLILILFCIYEKLTDPFETTHTHTSRISSVPSEHSYCSSSTRLMMYEYFRSSSAQSVFTHTPQKGQARPGYTSIFLYISSIRTYLPGTAAVSNETNKSKTYDVS